MTEITQQEIADRVAKVFGIMGAEFKACSHCGRHMFHAKLGLQEVLIDQTGALHQLTEADEPQASDLVARIRALYSLIGSRPKTCDHCPATVWMIPTKKGARMPMQADGFPHWGKCPGANLARRSR